jgi:hypothetical protein
VSFFLSFFVLLLHGCLVPASVNQFHVRSLQRSASPLTSVPSGPPASQVVNPEQRGALPGPSHSPWRPDAAIRIQSGVDLVATLVEDEECGRKPVCTRDNEVLVGHVGTVFVKEMSV